MKKILLLAVLATILAVPASAQAGPVQCASYQNGVYKEMPRRDCAWWNMAAYAYNQYFILEFLNDWQEPGRFGNYHARWLWTPDGVSRRTLQLSARYRCNSFDVYDHRLGVYAPDPAGSC